MNPGHPVEKPALYPLLHKLTLKFIFFVSVKVELEKKFKSGFQTLVYHCSKYLF